MKNSPLFRGETIGHFLTALGTASGILLVILLIYFYIYLPGSTAHGDHLQVPDFRGLPSEKIDSAIEASGLRYEINDSSYNEDYGPLEISRQFPAPGSMVKPGRKIYVSINRTDPPTVPVPALADLSVINAQSILMSNGLRLGKIIYKPGPFNDLVMELAINGYTVHHGVRVPKGTYIDLVVSDGGGPRDFVLSNLTGLSYPSAMLMISSWNLHLGAVNIAEGIDTTGMETFVYKQDPLPGDSVRLGQPVNLWIGPKGYEDTGDSTDVRR